MYLSVTPVIDSQLAVLLQSMPSFCFSRLGLKRILLDIRKYYKYGFHLII
jgi:hypothetical protein